VTIKAQLFITCLGENFFSHALKDMVTVLERLSVECELPKGQTCCGQPFYNSGYQRETIGVHGPKALHVWVFDT